jgi:hypothetical protein
MNCRPGDLARVVGLDARLGLNDKIVRLTNAPAFMLDGMPHWHLEAPVRTVLPTPGISMGNGALVPAGVPLIARSLPDEYLRPIRPQAHDAVDEMVRLVGAAPKTLTEVREVNHG